MTVALDVPGAVLVSTAADINDATLRVLLMNPVEGRATPLYHCLLAADKVCYVGDLVAIVIAGVRPRGRGRGPS